MKFTNQRCPDCPLTSNTFSEHCQIHDQWLELINKYVGDEIDSKKYVENSLKLLANYKEELKVKLNKLS